MGMADDNVDVLKVYIQPGVICTYGNGQAFSIGVGTFCMGRSLESESDYCPIATLRE